MNNNNVDIYMNDSSNPKIHMIALNIVTGIRYTADTTISNLFDSYMR
jgi:hypothetical protein